MAKSKVPLPSSVAGGLLRLARMDAGISQRELARRAGVPQSMIAAYERGHREPTLPTLLRLLRAAGFDLQMHLVPADDHDESLAWQRAQLSDEERCRRNEAEADFVRAAATRLPSGTEGFADLARDAVTLAVGDVPARVASLEDVIRSKRAAGRPKDLAVLPTLIATAQRQNRNRPAPE